MAGVAYYLSPQVQRMSSFPLDKMVRAAIVLGIVALLASGMSVPHVQVSAATARTAQALASALSPAPVVSRPVGDLDDPGSRAYDLTEELELEAEHDRPGRRLSCGDGVSLVTTWWRRRRICAPSFEACRPVTTPRALVSRLDAGGVSSRGPPSV
ncbi:MAG TPA: hypothetical protein ENK57_05180 [Polyangiaceae bacterium]|nr:hypothetical protein [Polyangiaceae bacterium]